RVDGRWRRLVAVDRDVETLARDDRVGACVRVDEQLVERPLDRVREDVGAADHRAAEHDRDAGQYRAELAPREPAEGDSDHAAASSSITAWIVCGSHSPSSRTMLPSPRKRTRWATAAARASCVTMTIVCPYSSTERRRRSRISWLVAEAGVPVGACGSRTGRA